MLLFEKKRGLERYTSSFIELNNNSFFKKVLLKSASSFGISSVNEQACAEASYSCNS